MRKTGWQEFGRDKRIRERWKHSLTLPPWGEQCLGWVEGGKVHLRLRGEAGKGLENQGKVNPPPLTAPFDPLGFDP